MDIRLLDAAYHLCKQSEFSPYPDRLVSRLQAEFPGIDAPRAKKPAPAPRRSSRRHANGRSSFGGQITTAAESHRSSFPSIAPAFPTASTPMPKRGVCT